MSNSFRGAVMLLAHQLRQRTDVTFSHCLRLAWKAWKLTRSMRKQTVPFRYRKMDGTVRTARGRIVEYQDSIIPTNSGCVVYYDVDRLDFRSFRVENLL